MTEEQVTKAFLFILQKNKWDIICFDFPQSGTGKLLHPNNDVDELGHKIPSINPDIVAYKNDVCIFFENKNRTYIKDFYKVNGLIKNNQYTNSIKTLVMPRKIKKYYYGIGLPTNKYSNYGKSNCNLVDFVFGIDEFANVSYLHNPHGIVL